MADLKPVSHSLERTSPKGKRFVGRCVLCGKENLPASEALQLCENPRGVSEEQAIAEAVRGPDEPTCERDGEWSELRRLLMEFGWDSTGDPLSWLRARLGVPRG